MGSFLDKPKTDKSNESGEGNQLRYGVAAMQGWRIDMEDSHSSVVSVARDGLDACSFFAVFDGHAGATVSKRSSQQLLNCILDADKHLFANLAHLYKNPHTNTANTATNQPPSALSSPSSSSDSVNNRAEFDGDKLDKQLRAAIRAGFLNLDEQLRRSLEADCCDDKSGTTAVASLITPSHIYLINCGDSRAILVSDNQIVLGTSDHKPINPVERERIQNAGGSVMIQRRVNGSLAVSRALGDYEYKNVEGRGPCEQLVSPEPEIYARPRTDQDEFIVLACDGIWDVISNEDLKDYVHSRLKVTNDLVKISNEILDMCLNKGSRDNMSIIIVALAGAPIVTQEEVDRDNICNEKIESKVK
ncbi:phosphatase 1B isoform X2, partial [Brachionus plicatilis]